MPPLAIALISGIPDAERRLPHWSGVPLRAFVVVHDIPDAERRLPHWSVSAAVRAAGLPLIPDAERRLPHWSAFRQLADRATQSNSRRRKASASLERMRGRRTLGFTGRFQTPKGVCLIGAWISGYPLSFFRHIPDAERRLPHWSFVSDVQVAELLNLFQTPKGVCLIGADFCEETREDADVFQTPKGVCLIGAPAASPRCHLRLWHSRRRKASASLERIRPARGARGRDIPDAERRLPHWSPAGEASIPPLSLHSRRRKASASLERVQEYVPVRVAVNSRRRKASASLERRIPIICMVVTP